MRERTLAGHLHRHQGVPRMPAIMTLPVAEAERSGSTGVDFAFDYRRRRELEESERAELKRLDLETQSSPLNSAEMRIRAWEKVHRLSMPSNPSHPALAVIAAATQLALAEVQNEQRLRAARRAVADA
ncbi:MAG TPA: hypothetical protein VFN79_16085 [Steroidobacteraceae bacterium]|nr:hypothetical protein [Steroidobacteraceae bacterium]